MSHIVALKKPETVEVKETNRVFDLVLSPVADLNRLIFEHVGLEVANELNDSFLGEGAFRNWSSEGNIDRIKGLEHHKPILVVEPQ